VRRYQLLSDTLCEERRLDERDTASTEVLLRFRKEGERKTGLKEHPEQGVALVLSIIILSLLVVIAYQFSFSVSVDRRLTSNFASRSCNYFAARGALTLLRAYLKKDLTKNAIDTLNDCWREGEYLSECKMGDATVSVDVWDAESLLKLNNLSKKTNKFYQRTKSSLKRLLEVLDIEAETGGELADRICDWIDADDDGDYEEDAPNKPLFVIEDLLSIEGVTESFYKGWVDEFGESHKGLYETTTVWGSGKVNINTAPKEVLMAISSAIGETEADNIIEYRQEEDFNTPQDLTKVDGLSNIFNRDRTLRNFITTVSTDFIAHIKATTEGRTLRIRAVLRRSTKGIKLLLWKEE